MILQISCIAVLCSGLSTKTTGFLGKWYPSDAKGRYDYCHQGIIHADSLLFLKENIIWWNGSGVDSIKIASVSPTMLEPIVNPAGAMLFKRMRGNVILSVKDRSGVLHVVGNYARTVKWKRFACD